MNNDNSIVISEVVNAIGQEDPEDYRIQPTAFAEALEQPATELAGIVKHSELVECAKRYEENDQRAVITQSLFRRLSTVSTWAIFIATAAAALLASLTAVFPTEPTFVMRVFPFSLIRTLRT